MNQIDRAIIFDLHVGQKVTWEGYIVSFNGFSPYGLAQFPFEKQIGLTLSPRKSPVTKLIAKFKIGSIIPTDGVFQAC